MQLAEKFWIASTKESATNFESRFNLGILYLNQGKFQDSLGAFLKAKNISPHHPFIDVKIQEVKSKIE
jgi:tetratricopeptide (TPR) repeat protein